MVSAFLPAYTFADITIDRVCLTRNCKLLSINDPRRLPAQPKYSAMFAMFELGVVVSEKCIMRTFRLGDFVWYMLGTRYHAVAHIMNTKLEQQP